MGEHYDPELINKLLESEDAAPLYVLSNSNGLYGASCLVYQNVLKDFADHLQADLTSVAIQCPRSPSDSESSGHFL
ncbi:MAG: DUF5688 family protein [Clostridium sp.]